MRLQLAVFGRTLVRLELELAPDPDNGTDPGDATATGHPVGFVSRWELPASPALEPEL